MTLKADLFLSFRSPYSYLAIGRYRALAAEWSLDIAAHPVWPLAVRDPGFFAREDPLWLPYLLRDIARVAEHLGLPLARPAPDPIAMDMETRAIAAEQPLIGPITRLGVAAARRGPGPGLDFAFEALSMIWGGVAGWNAPDRLGPAAARAGLDLAALEADVAGREAAFDAEIDANQEALKAAGHWGVPTLVFDGEPFFGQDRIDLALWRMKRAGQAPR